MGDFIEAGRHVLRPVICVMCRGLSISLRDQGSVEGVQFTNISVESLFYERVWLGGAEPIHITAMPRSLDGVVSSVFPRALSCMSYMRKRVLFRKVISCESACA